MFKLTTPSDVPLTIDDRVKRGNALVERIGSEVAIVDLATHRVSTLNPVGAMIWDSLIEPNTVRHCAQVVEGNMGGHVSSERIADDTLSFIVSLVARGLLVRA